LLSPSQRSHRARLAAFAQKAKHPADELTSNARRAFFARFEREVDPEGKLPEAERLRRAEYARRAYFARLSWRAVKARAARKAAALSGVAS